QVPAVGKSGRDSSRLCKGLGQTSLSPGAAFIMRGGAALAACVECPFYAWLIACLAAARLAAGPGCLGAAVAAGGARPGCPGARGQRASAGGQPGALAAELSP